jgi:hypothetical protein
MQPKTTCYNRYRRVQEKVKALREVDYDNPLVGSRPITKGNGNHERDVS